MYAYDIFHGEYIFDRKVMGVPTSQEIQEAFLRTTPIYFRGVATYTHVKQLLDVQLSSGKYVRDLVRHLRVYLRFERFATDRSSVSSSVVPLESLFSASQLEVALYQSYSGRLDGLEQLSLRDHKIKLEICVFYFFNVYDSRDSEEDCRMRCNLFQTVKPAYYKAKSAGADVTVHWEEINVVESVGTCVDATELYTPDSPETEVQICSFHGDGA
jgi:hypothetical protein